MPLDEARSAVSVALEYRTPEKKVAMKKFVFASLLALSLTAVAGREAHAGTWSFGMSWCCWKDYCFPCVDPALFGLPNGAGYGGGYAGYGHPVYYGTPGHAYAPQAPAAPAASYVQPGWNTGYQSAGYYYPTQGYYGQSGYGYGY